MRFGNFLFITILYLATLQAQPATGQILYFGDLGNPSSLDPVNAAKPVEHHLCQFVFESLVVLRCEGDFAFSLAKELDISPDGLSYTFILHKNLKWADGVPLTAKDVEFTVELLLNSKSNDAILATYIEEVICINPQAITITLSRPFYSPLSLFTFKILPKHKFSSPTLDLSHPFAREPVGCGPFRYHSDRSEKEFVLIRNQYHRQAFLEKVVARLYVSKKDAVKQLLDRQIHMVTEVSPQDIPMLEQKREHFVLARYCSRSIHFVAVNHRQGHRHRHLFADVDFRRSLIYGADRKEILHKIFYAGKDTTQTGQAHKVISGPFPANSWAYNDQIQPLSYDPDQARSLLKHLLIQKGYQQDAKHIWTHASQGPLSLTLQYVKGDQEIEAACEQIASYWKNVGISIDLIAQDERSFQQQVLLDHNFDMAYMKYNFDNTIDVFPLFDPTKTSRGESNFSGYVDTKLTELFSQLHNTLNPWVLRSISHKIHQTVHEDAVHIFLWQLDMYAAHHRSLKNVQLHPYYLFNFTEKWKIVEE